MLSQPETRTRFSASAQLAEQASYPEQSFGEIKDYLDPRDFQWGWDLSVSEMAECLGVEERTVRAYFVRPELPTHRNPPKPVMRLASVLTKYWISQGRVPTSPQFLVNKS